MQKLSPRSVLAHSSKMAFESFEDGALILDLEKRKFMDLNTSAGEIVHSLNGNVDLQQVAENLANEYGITPDAALQDVLALVSQLIAQDLLVEQKSSIQSKG